KRRRLRKDGGEIDGARHHENREDAKRKAEVTDAIDDESLDGSRIRLRLMEPEPDEQITHQADPFPPEEQLRQVVGCHQRQHRKGRTAQKDRGGGAGTVLFTCSRENKGEGGPRPPPPPPTCRGSPYGPTSPGHPADHPP